MGFEARLSLDFWFQNKLFPKIFEKSFREKTKACSESFVFAWLAALQVSKQFWQTFCSAIINAREKKLKKMFYFWIILGWQETLHAYYFECLRLQWKFINNKAWIRSLFLFEEQMFEKKSFSNPKCLNTMPCFESKFSQ